MIPACRVTPSSTGEVITILNVLVDNWCTFAVKGGGHSRSKDAANSVGGVTIDLMNMNTVSLSSDHSSATIGAGVHSIDGYIAMEPYNLTFLGGRDGTVGISGFNMGGGISTHIAEYGFAMDNVYNYEVSYCLLIFPIFCTD